MKRPKIWYVSFDISTGSRVRKTQSFESESEAKQFAKAALVSGKSVFAGTIIPYAPRRFISPEEIYRWLNPVEPSSGYPL